MSYFDRLKNAKPKSTAAGSAGKMVAETFVVNVTGYENVDAKSEQERFVVGKRVDTGEEVRVYLRPDESGGKFARHGVAEFATYGQRKSEKSATEPGGEIRFDGVFPDKDRAGVFSANWAQVTSHYKGEARSVRTYVRMNRANIKPEKSSVTVEVVRNMDAVVVSDFAQLKTELVKALTPVNEGNIAVFALVRAFAPNGDVVSLPVYPRKNEDVKDKYVMVAPEVSVDAFLDGDNAELLNGILDSGEAQVEVMRGTRFFMGRQTVDTAQEKGRLAEIDKRWRFQDNPDANGFVESWVTLRHLTDKKGDPITPTTLIVTHAAAATSSSPVVGFDQLPSPAALGLGVAVKEPVAEAPAEAPAENPVAVAAQDIDDQPDLVITDDEQDLERAQQSYAQQQAGKSRAPTPF